MLDVDLFTLMASASRIAAQAAEAHGRQHAVAVVASAFREVLIAAIETGGVALDDVDGITQKVADAVREHVLDPGSRKVN